MPFTMSCYASKDDLIKALKSAYDKLDEDHKRLRKAARFVLLDSIQCAEGNQYAITAISRMKLKEALCAGDEHEAV